MYKSQDPSCEALSTVRGNSEVHFQSRESNTHWQRANAHHASGLIVVITDGQGEILGCTIRTLLVAVC